MSNFQDVRILYIEDDPDAARLVQKCLERAGYTVDLACDGAEGLQMYNAAIHTLVAVDQNMPVYTGLDVIRSLASRGSLPPLIMITGTGSEEVAVEAMKLGASDYLVKDVEGRYLRLLPLVIERTLKQQQLAEQKRVAEEALREREAIYRAMFEKNWAVKLLIEPTTGAIVDANPAASAFYGYSLDRLRTMNIADINDLPPQEIAAEMEQARNQQRVYFNFRHRLATGEVRYVEVYSGPIETRGRVLLYSVIHDITDRVQAEAALRAAHVELEQRVQERTAELAHTNQALYAEIAERHRAEADLRRRNEQLAILNLVTEAVNQSLALPEVLITLRSIFAQHLHITAGVIYLYHEAEDSLSIETVWGIPEPAPLTISGQLAVASAHNWQVVREQIPVILDNIPCLPPALEALQCTFGRTHYQYLGIPLLAQGEIQGVLDLFSTHPEAFHTDHITLYTTVGQQAGSAIQKARLFEQAQTARERLQALSWRLVEVQENERRTIARELHDEVGQILTGMRLSIDMLCRLPVEKVACRLEQLRTLVEELMQRVREMSLQLRPPMLDDLGLLPTLRWYIDRYMSQTGIQVIFKHGGLDQRRFAANIETAVYRMVQEGLTNVARYAETPEVVVRVWATDTMLGVQIEDQGRGFDPVRALDKHASIGLSGMRERMLLLGGDLRIQSAPGQGSRLAVELPL